MINTETYEIQQLCVRVRGGEGEARIIHLY